MLRRKARAFYSLAHGYREGITTRCNYVGGSCDCIEKEWNVTSRKCERGRSGRQQPIVLRVPAVSKVLRCTPQRPSVVRLTIQSQQKVRGSTRSSSSLAG